MKRNRKLENYINAHIAHQSYIKYERDDELEKISPEAAKLKDKLSMDAIKTQYKIDPIKVTRRRYKSLSRTSKSVIESVRDMKETQREQK